MHRRKEGRKEKKEGGKEKKEIKIGRKTLRRKDD